MAITTIRHALTVTSGAGLIDALTELRGVLREAPFPLALASAGPARSDAAALAQQCDDYLLPRLSRLDAPMLVVVGGSTGAGKSTLVNSLVRAPVSAAGVLRPTTRSPVLVANPSDAAWFIEPNLLPGLARTTGLQRAPGELQVLTAPGLTPGLALLDAPDIDSVVDRNRELATQLLAAADLWLFVTTAARYADAVPWSVLRTAQERGTVVALVLDRVPAGAEDEIADHLSEMLGEQGLADTPLVVLPEVALDGQGLLEERLIHPLHQFLSALASDAAARAEVVGRTVAGALGAVGPRVDRLVAAAVDQVATARSLRETVDRAYAAGVATVTEAASDGTLLRGEVLARWQEFVGTGELTRALQAQVGRVRDRVAAVVGGLDPPGGRFAHAVSTGLVTLTVEEAAGAAERTYAAWQADAAGAALLQAAREDLSTPSPDLPERAGQMVRDWQRGILELVRTEGQQRRRRAKFGAYAVNASGLLVMIAVFASTAFIPTGAEIAVAGGTTIAAQKLLEAIFGDQAMRTLAARSREDLQRRIGAVFAVERDRYLRLIGRTGVASSTPDRLRNAAHAVAQARVAAGFADTEPAPTSPATVDKGAPV